MPLEYLLRTTIRPLIILRTDVEDPLGPTSGNFRNTVLVQDFLAIA